MSDDDLMKCPECGVLISIRARRKVEWWELLDWNRMTNTFDKLPKELQDEIRERGLIKKKKK